MYWAVPKKYIKAYNTQYTYYIAVLHIYDMKRVSIKNNIEF